MTFLFVYLDAEPEFRQRSLSMDRSNVPLLPTLCDRNRISFDLIEWLETKTRGMRVAGARNAAYSAPLAFLYGLPGIGKSVVAKAFGHKAYDRNWRVVYGDATDCESAHALGERIVDALGLDPSSVSPQRALVKASRDGERVALILDGCDRLIETKTSEFVDFLVDALQARRIILKILVTSRTRLYQNRFDDVVFDVGPLEASDAAQFLERQIRSEIRANQADSLAKYSCGHPMLLDHFVELVNSNATSAMKLVRKIAMMKKKNSVWLALEQLLTKPVAQRDRVDYLFWDCLQRALGGDDDDDERIAIATGLAVFPGDFSESAAEAVLGKERIVSFMADRSLLQRLDGDRFQLNPLLRSYLSHLAKTRYADLYRKMKTRYYMHYVERLKQLSCQFFKCAEQALNKYDVDKHNYKSVFVCSPVPGVLHESYMDTILRLNYFLKFRLTYDELITLYKKCIDLAVGREQATVKARLHILLADVYVRLGRADDAIEELNEPKRVFKDSAKDGHTLALASCYATLGNAHRSKGNLVVALVNLQKAKELHDRNPELDNECRVSVLQALGATYAHLNFHPKALDYYDKARCICKRRLGQRSSQDDLTSRRRSQDDSVFKRRLGQRSSQDDLTSRRRSQDDSVFRRSKLLSLVRGIHPYAVEMEMSIAELKALSGQYESAKTHLNEVIRIQERLKVEIVASFLVSYTEGALLYLNGEKETGVRHMEEALAVSSGFIRFFIGFTLGKLQYNQRQFVPALEKFEIAADVADALSYTGNVYVELLVYGCIAARVAGIEDKASRFEERLQSVFGQTAWDEMLSPVLNVCAGSTVVPKANEFSLFYNQFCCRYRCLVSYYSAKFPFPDPGRCRFPLSVTLDQTATVSSVDLPTPSAEPTTDFTKSINWTSFSQSRIAEASDDDSDNDFPKTDASSQTRWSASTMEISIDSNESSVDSVPDLPFKTKKNLSRSRSSTK